MNTILTIALFLVLTISIVYAQDGAEEDTPTCHEPCLRIDGTCLPPGLCSKKLRKIQKMREGEGGGGVGDNGDKDDGGQAEDGGEGAGAEEGAGEEAGTGAGDGADVGADVPTGNCPKHCRNPKDESCSPKCRKHPANSGGRGADGQGGKGRKDGKQRKQRKQKQGGEEGAGPDGTIIIDGAE